jgi:hypothetical protein
MKNLHLIISSVLIAGVAIAYGYAPSTLLTQILLIKVDTTDLQHIFRAIMGLYLAMTALWIIGIFRPRYWQTATISNIFFMSGLAFGRLISFILDGQPSVLLTAGFLIEIFLAALAYLNWTRRKGSDSPQT